MDTQLLYVLGGIAFVVAMPWLEERLSGKIKKKTKSQRVLSPQRQQPVYPTEIIEKPDVPTPTPLLFEEGTRITSDKPEKTSDLATEQPNNIKVPDIDGLRRAVIWSEILKPKF